MNQPFAKVCILLRPDELSMRVIEVLVGRLMNTSGVKEEGSLPYHLTILGGGRIEDTREGRRLLNHHVQQLKPFASADFLPVVKGVEPIPLFGGFIAIRLKFKPGSYVLTGDRQHNKKMARAFLSNHHFDFIRHITLCEVGNDFKVMDGKLRCLEDLLHEQETTLLRMTFTPEVWLKTSGTNTWNRYEWKHEL